MTTYPVRKDHRYTITREYTGHISGKPQYVARFCGEWIGSSSFHGSAVMLAVGHNCQRKGALVVTEERA